MKKRILFAALAFLGVLNTSAYSVDDFVYTPTAKYQVTGGNLFENGNFKSSTDGWTTDGTTAISLTEWSVSEGTGPNKENTLLSTYQSGGIAAKSVSLPAGLYCVSYAVKSTGDLNTTVTAGSTTNYVGIYYNTDGAVSTSSAGYRLTSETHKVTNSWTVVNDTVTVDAAGYLVVELNGIASGTEFANFEVHAIKSVFDDRVATRLLTYCDELAGSKEWANANESGVANGLSDFQENINTLKEAMKDKSSATDASVMGDLMSTLQTALATFLDANSADMSGKFTGWEENSTKTQNASAIGDWVLTPARWYHCNNVYTAEEIAQIYEDYPYGDVLPNGSATLTKTMGAGRYMFALDLKGHHMLSKATTGSNWTADLDGAGLVGASLFANDQTLTCDTLNTRNFTTYTLFFTAEDKENNVVVGAKYTNPSDAPKTGGNFYLANVKLRKLGVTTSDINYETALAGIIAQQKALKARLDSATNIKALAEYPWGKADLEDSIKFYQSYYDESLSKVDANGKVLNSSVIQKDENGVYESTSDTETELLGYVRKMNNIIAAYYKKNLPYTTLNADIVNAKTSLAAENHASASASTRTALETAIANSEKVVAGVTSVADSLSFATSDEALLAAVKSFEFTTATATNPAEITLVNPNFATNVSGWSLSANNTAKELYKKGTNTSFDSGTCAYAWRGNTASPNNKLVQNVDLSAAGLYEYRSNAYGMNEVKGYDLAMATISQNATTLRNDTVYNLSKLRMFFGLSGVPDSVSVHSRIVAWNGNAQVNGYVASTYSVFYNKPNDTKASAELGMSSFGQIDKAGANAFGFGDNHVYYYGDSVAYAKSLATDLQTQIDLASKTVNEDTLVNAKLVEPSRAYLPHRVVSAIAVAKSAKTLTEMANAKWALLAVLKDFSTLATGVQGVFVDDETATKVSAKGVYNLSGLKVSDSTDKLPAGLYIVNGKKVIVK